MLNIHTLTLGQMQTNCYILSGDGKHCMVIDPGYDPMTILSTLEMEELTLDAILLTHGHFDHVGAVKALAVETDCAVYLNEKELALPPMMTAGPLFYTHSYRDGDVLSLAGLTITVMETPGHTPGSVCLLVDDAMFSGDTLFEGSCGRVDFPGSSPADMRASLTKLRCIERNYWVYPGHGSATTLTKEKRYNPYLKGML